MKQLNNVRHPHPHGFTLIEVLVALIVLAIVSLAVMTAMENAIDDTIRVQDDLAARLVAMNVLSQMQTGSTAIPTNEETQSGESDMLGQAWSWQSGVAQGGSHFYERVYVNVFKAQQRIVHLEGFVGPSKH